MSVSSPPDVNFWFDKRCARAFWSQCELPPYRELLAHTTEWMAPTRSERWLDLGCGSGQLTRAIWDRSDFQWSSKCRNNIRLRDIAGGRAITEFGFMPPLSS